MHRTGAAIFLLIVLVSSFAVTLAPKAAYGAVGQRDWWNAEWRARIPILVVNSANVSRVNEAAFVYLNLESLGVASALTELRVVDGGEEVPSWVIWEDRGESWVRGVYLLFLLNVKAGEEKVFHAYVSNPGVNVPSYRTGNASVPIKFPSISVGPVVAASTVSFGGTFSIGDLVLLRSDEWGLARYGAAEIGGQRVKVLDGWHAVGNFSKFGANVLATTLRVRDVTWVRTVMWNDENVVLRDLFVNTGARVVPGLEFYEIVDFSSLASLGFVRGKYDVSTGVADVSVGGSYIGWRSSIPPLAYSVGPRGEVLSGVQRLKFNGVSEADGDILFGAAHALGWLLPGQTSEVARYLTLASRESAVHQALQDLTGVRVFTLQAEYPDTTLPRLGLMQRAAFEFTNVSIAKPIGLFVVEAPEWSVIPGEARVSGVVKYRVPDKLSAEFESSAFWVARKFEATGVSSFASSKHFAGSDLKYIGRVSVLDRTGFAFGNASLSSPFMIVEPARSVSLDFTYRALVTGSNLTSIRLYVAVGLDFDFDSRVDRWLSLPLEGSVAVGSVVGQLVGDGQWHEILVDIIDAVRIQPLQSVFRIEAVTDDRFQGIVELEVGRIALRVSGDASEVFRATTDSTTSLVTVQSYPDLIVDAPQGDMRLTLHLVRSEDASGLDGGEFKWIVEEPQVKAVNVTRGVSTPKLALSWSSAAVYDISADQLLSVSVNGVLVSPSQFSQSEGAVILREDTFESLASTPTLHLEVGFAVGVVRIHVKDLAGRDLSEATVQLRDGLGRIVFSGEADANGVFVAKVVRGEYFAEVVYHDSSLVTSLVSVLSSADMVEQVRVYRQSLRLLDNLGFPVGGAEIKFQRGNRTVAEATTGIDGSASLSLLAGEKYDVAVLVYGIVVHRTGLTPAVDDAIILLNTGYFPIWLQVMLAAAIVLGVALPFVLPSLRQRLKIS